MFLNDSGIYIFKKIASHILISICTFQAFLWTKFKVCARDFYYYDYYYYFPKK